MVSIAHGNNTLPGCKRTRNVMHIELRRDKLLLMDFLENMLMGVPNP